MSDTIATEIHKLSPSALIELFEIDATGINNTLPKLYFHSGVNYNNSDVVWSSLEGASYVPHTYVRYPIMVEGFEWSGKGTLPRPTLKASNVTGAVSALILAYQGLLGAKVIRRRTFVKYLDAVNFPGNTNPLADPSVHFPEEIWYIDRKASENSNYVEFELAASFDIAGIRLPKRQCVQNLCSWKYRGPECGYTGINYFDTFDVEVSTLQEDECSKRLSSCEMRFGRFSELPYGGFPAVGIIR